MLVGAANAADNSHKSSFWSGHTGKTASQGEVVGISHGQLDDLQVEDRVSRHRVSTASEADAAAHVVTAQQPEGSTSVFRVHVHSSAAGGAGRSSGMANGASERTEEVTEAAPQFEESEATSLKVGSARRVDLDDDEFSYAFNGGRRDDFHKQVFKPKAMPAHMVTNVQQQLQGALEEGDEEEEEAEDVGSSAADGQGVSEQIYALRNRKPEGSWTTFVPNSGAHSEVNLDQGVDDDDDPVPGFVPVEDLGVNLNVRNGRARIRNVTDVMAEAQAKVVATVQAQAALTSQQSKEEFPSERLLRALLPARPPDRAPTNESMMSHSHNSRNSNSQQGSTNTDAHAKAEVIIAPRTERPHSQYLDDLSLTHRQLDEHGLAIQGKLASSGYEQQAGSDKAALRNNISTSGAADEWDVANMQRLRELDGKGISANGGNTVSYHEALLHFMSLDTSTSRKAVETTLPGTPGLIARLMCIGPPPLTQLLREQQLQLLCLARIPFDDAQPMHLGLLNSLYAAFTGCGTQQPRHGSHWEDIGFQGLDPATDLRGCGILGLLHLYYLYQHDAVGAGSIHQLSRMGIQAFPLAIVSLNITKWTLQATREGLLSRDANLRGSLVEASQEFYIGTFRTFYRMWLDGRKTMAQSGFVMKELEATAKRRPAAMIAAAAGQLV